MLKILAISFLSTTLLCAPKQTIFPPRGMSIEQTIAAIQEKKAKQEVEFAFDIHKVLVQKSTKSIMQTIFNSPYKWQLFTAFTTPRLLVGLAGMAWQAILNTAPWAPQKYKELTAEELICIVRAYGNKELLTLVIQIVNTQQVDPEVKDIVIELKNLGYPLRIASNIGKEIYLQLKQQLQDSNSNIFAYFDQDETGMEGKTIDYRVSPIQKPDLKFFQEFLDAYNPERKKLIIFVDDKAVNVKAATQLGFVGIHFKNAAQLAADLRQLDVL